MFYLNVQAKGSRGVKKVFLEISQTSQVSSCARIFFNKVIFNQEFCKISKNTFSYRKPLVAASDKRIYGPVKHL